MVKGVNDDGSQPDENDDRGVPIKNLQAEFSRKLSDMETKMADQMKQFTETLSQKLDSLTVNETAPEPVSVDEKQELVKISQAPRRYVEQFMKPLEERAKLLEDELKEQRKATLTAQWERMEDRIARLEKKTDWNDVPEDFRKEIRQEIMNRQWQGNPSSAIDAYEIVRARRLNLNAGEPDRLSRIRDGQSEGATSRSSGGGGSRTITNDALDQLASTLPSHPDYKKNMETLDKVQKGQIKVEG